jgi:hypothetical protein
MRLYSKLIKLIMDVDLSCLLICFVKSQMPKKIKAIFNIQISIIQPFR